ncbi:MAG: 3-phosphoserine/phosphohydroxythreonine transaminase [Sutterellaceae bacterium]|nr:3-phosphoserine/phosphohydroxythreonine transaminase [Sutterellaceae bacterium]
MSRVYNFSAGPGVLPVTVLEEVAAQMVDYHGQGMSLVEMSHRGATFTQIIRETKEMLRDLLSVPETHDILLLQGGGHMQFAMVPLNLLGAAAEATYIVNGIWSKKAAAEAQKFCHVNTIGTPVRAAVPDSEDIIVPNDAAYLYYCMNETVNGLEFNYVPSAPECVPLVSDVSSNFLSRLIDFKRHSLVFAGAQKNFGPAGLSVVIVRKDLLGIADEVCPTMLNYEVHAQAESMYNTPPTFAIWVANLVCRWLLDEGGVEVMNERAKARCKLVYDAIDTSDGFYINNIAAAHRSRMNVVFNIAEEALTDLFIREAEKENLKNLKGHRLVGGLRASLYNAMPMDGAKILSEFMREFARKHG